MVCLCVDSKGHEGADSGERNKAERNVCGQKPRRNDGRGLGVLARDVARRFCACGRVCVGLACCSGCKGLIGGVLSVAHGVGLSYVGC